MHLENVLLMKFTFLFQLLQFFIVNSGGELLFLSLSTTLRKLGY